MTLRTRTLLASGVAVAILVLMGIVLLGQFAITAGGNIALQQGLSPAVDRAAALSLEQSDASGALADYVMVERDASLDDFRQTIGRATTLLDELSDELAADEVLTALVGEVRTAQRQWVKTDAEPTISLMEAGKRARAMRETNTPEAWASYDRMTAATSALHSALNDTRDEAAAAVGQFTVILGFSLLGVGLLVAVGLGLFLAGLQAWVLSPLTRLREDLQRATEEQGHLTPIRPVGPPELRAVGKDAEYLRRGLVREIDEARAAKEGLVQDAPLVAAMQAELAGGLPEQVAGLAVAGSSQSAEGVVAGDWWDQIVRPDGSVALVVADVSGHGPEASVTAVRVRAIIRAALRGGLDPSDVMTMAAESCADDRHFVTGIVLTVDPAADTLTWCNAGHHPAIVVTRDKEATLCEPTGPLLSSLGGEWHTHTRSFAFGDVVVAFTDGLVESRNADGDELESAMVAQFIRGWTHPCARTRRN